MTQRGWKIAQGVIVALIATSTSASAAGLDIKPPPGFAVKASPGGDGAPSYEIASTTDPDAGCLVGFMAAQVSRGLDQSQINAAAGKQSYRDTVKSSVSSVYDVEKVEPFAMQGADGVAITGSPKAAQGAVKSLLVVIETPSGRLNVACVGPTGHFDGLRSGFEGVARGITLPR